MVDKYIRSRAIWHNLTELRNEFDRSLLDPRPVSSVYSLPFKAHGCPRAAAPVLTSEVETARATKKHPLAIFFYLHFSETVWLELVKRFRNDTPSLPLVVGLVPFTVHGCCWAEISASWHGKIYPKQLVSWVFSGHGHPLGLGIGARSSTCSNIRHTIFSITRCVKSLLLKCVCWPVEWQLVTIEKQGQHGSLMVIWNADMDRHGKPRGFQKLTFPVFASRFPQDSQHMRQNP